MTTHLIPDVFNGIAPIETTLVGAHPRLHLTSETLVDLRGKLFHAPWSRHFARVRRLADMKQLSEAALVYRKGLINLFRHYLPLADYCAIFDNSSAAPSLVNEQDAVAERALKKAVARVMDENQRLGLPVAVMRKGQAVRSLLLRRWGWCARCGPLTRSSIAEEFFACPPPRPNVCYPSKTCQPSLPICAMN